MGSNIGNTPSINRMSVLEAPSSLICIGYRRESSESSGESEKWSNCKIGGNIARMSGYGRNGEVIHEIIDK